MEPTLPQMKSIISKYIDINHSRLKDYEVEFLYQFVVQYDRFRNLTIYTESSLDGWASDGKYTTWYKDYYYFGQNEIGIYDDYNYYDDEGKKDKGTSSVEMSARKVINWFINVHEQPPLDNVRDIMAIIMVPYYESQAKKHYDWLERKDKKKIKWYLEG